MGAPQRSQPPQLLVGRGAELATLQEFLDRALHHGGALVVTGGLGVGKSAFLDAASQLGAEADARILRLGGVQFEAEVSFAGLNQLLLPLQTRLGELPRPHEEALSSALGMGRAPADGWLSTAAATLALLRDVARDSPVLVVVDDVQWLDTASARILGFVARRLEGSRIGVLAAAREESDCYLVHAGLSELALAPLDDDASLDLLDSRFPVLAPSVRRRVLAVAQGNPLALLELPVSMTEDQRQGVAFLPSALPVSDQLQRQFATRLQRLPPSARWLLLLAALDGTGDLSVLQAGSVDDRWLDRLAPAEEDRLVRVDSGAGRIAFRNPLIGATVVELATTGERQRAHAVLADQLTQDPERRAWHLAHAAVGSDETAAGLLELAATRALRKGDAVRAVHALLRAADLSTRGADRARRLAAAAYVGADATGRLSSVPQLLREARRANPGAPGPLEVTVAAAYHLLNGEGDVDTAHLMLERAIDDALGQGQTGPAVEEALHSLMSVCHFSGRHEPWRPLESALRRLGPEAPSLLTVWNSVYADPATRVSATELEELTRLIATLDAEVDPTRIVRIAMAAFHVDRLSACRSALWRVVRDGRDGGAASSAVQALMLLCHDAFRGGRWDEAARMAQEGITWGERLGYRLATMPGVYCRMLVSAARGDDEETESLTEELLNWGAPRGALLLEHFAHHARTLGALGRGDYEAAYRHAVAIGPPGVLATHVPLAVWVAKDLVEAAVRTGRHAEAVAHVAAIGRAEIFRLRPRLALLAAGAAALVAPAAAAGECFEAALAAPGAERFPFERARVQLAYGEHLRRTRATSAARLQLDAALETFQRLDARPWSRHAWLELRASGRNQRSLPEAGGVSALTPQEHEIASLAASGLSNKEIGRRLFLSPRTVSGHLYRVFPKLGVTARAALRDALEQTSWRDPWQR